MLNYKYLKAELSQKEDRQLASSFNYARNPVTVVL